MVALAALGLTAGCGAGASSDAETLLKAEAPISSTTDLDVGEATGMSDSVPTTSVLDDATTMAPGMDACHPHLFARSAEVVWRLNAVFNRHLRHVEHLVARRASRLDGGTGTWTETGSGLEVQRQLTISNPDAGTFEFELSLAPAGQTPPQWVKVLSGETTRTETSTVTERVGSVDFDYDALRTVIPAERLTGKIHLAFDRVVDSTKPAPGIRKVTTVTFDGFSFGPLDLHGPRNGSFTHVGEPGIGGSIAFQDSLVLLCPANPQRLVADTVTHARWFVTPAGGLHGRADAKGSGGQIPAGDTWLGVSCYQGARATRPVATMETGYWAMKLEDAAGATVTGSTHQAGTTDSCDAAFGPVPSQTSNATDYDFSVTPTFPNQW